jgi:hypothetical protein
VVLLYIRSPLAGEGIKLRSAVDKRGINTSPFVALTSSIAELLAPAPVVLIDTPFCEKAKFITIRFTIKKIDNCFMGFVVMSWELLANLRTANC